ncbi:carbamoyltransferase HypF [Cyanobium sp. FGCU-6]|nr:carbamoyltransferase HypF [Cyanobium sp. FGCU6]
MNGSRRLQLDCRGVVQGVGFRPSVHRLARRLGLTGVVENVPAGVRLELQGPGEALERFLVDLPAALPPAARLEPLAPRWLDPLPASALAAGDGVRILAALPRPLGIGLVAPALAADRAPCEACLRELEDPAGRRHGYPFLSCATCGPRYSIATAAPYCRAHTTLAAFPLCTDCRREFEDPGDRRFHAETIACPACGPRLAWRHADGRDADAPRRPASGELIDRAVALLAGGGILALQGVGGFQLLVDASDAAAVARLRRRKHRPAKPFALLVADPTWMQIHCCIDAEEEMALRDPAAPIVLLRRRPEAGEALPKVAPGSAALGVMLSASPLHHLLIRAFGRPLVATSGNRSGEPLCTDPDEALERLAGIADAFLVHDRLIARPLDDSVLQLIDGRPALLRRARGHAPLPLQLPSPVGAGEGALLALGGDLKCAPLLAAAGGLWPAPHLGDLADARVHGRLADGLAEIAASRDHGFQNEGSLRLACDGHPGYVSHQLARASGHPCMPVSHHRAHALAVAAEHRLEPPLLALTGDGLGLAPPEADGHRLWGGELLLLEPAGARRWAGLLPFPLPGGERAMAEPRRAGLGLLLAAGGEALAHAGAARLRSAFTANDLALLQQAVAAGCQSPLSSGMGRLFDAVAALLSLVQVATYEGEGGLRLEGAAAAAAGGRRAAVGAPAYPLPVTAAPAAFAGPPPPGGWLDWRPLLAALLDDIAADTPPGPCALRFHQALVNGCADLVQAAAESWGLRRVVLAGGCFQNRLLLEGLIAALRQRGLEPFWPSALPASDGGLALGQAWAALRPAAGGVGEVTARAGLRPASGDRPITNR